MQLTHKFNQFSESYILAFTNLDNKWTYYPTGRHLTLKKNGFKTSLGILALEIIVGKKKPVLHWRSTL